MEDEDECKMTQLNIYTRVHSKEFPAHFIFRKFQFSSCCNVMSEKSVLYHALSTFFFHDYMNFALDLVDIITSIV